MEPKLNGNNFKMEFDIGSAVSVMSIGIFQKCFHNVDLKPTNTILKTYIGENVKILGKAKIYVRLQ